MRTKSKEHTKLRSFICCECKKEAFDYLSPSELNKNRLCSSECRSIYFRKLAQRRSFIKNCSICNKEFRSQMKKEKRYCSRKCAIKGSVGRKCSKETIEKISKSRIGNQWKKGYKFPDKHPIRAKISFLKSGNKSNLWKGGLSNANNLIRQSFKYKLWRKSVYERDDYTCQSCGVHGIQFQVHHIKPLSEYPELIFDINNGVTLCLPCHEKTDSYPKNLIKSGILK